MRAENLPALEQYIDEHIATATTRHASENRFACPPLAEAVDAERFMRMTLHTMFDGQAAIFTPENVSAPADNLALLKRTYWDDARHVTDLHGAKPDFVLNDYFNVGQERHYDAIKDSVLADHEPGSIPVLLFESLDAYQYELDLDAVSASRILTTLFSTQMSHIKHAAAQLQASGVTPVEASKAAIVAFTNETVMDHISDLKKRASDGMTIKSAISKRSLYPEVIDMVSDELPLRLSRKDAEGLMKAYRIQERPYTDAELSKADEIMHTPAMQEAVLRFHMSLVEYARGYLAEHPERAQHSLEPFSEIFVPAPGEDVLRLIPNPKLIKVIGNNTMPAIAGVLLEAGGDTRDLDGSHIQEGIEIARKLRVFQAQIGQFNAYDAKTDTVDLASIFNRTCPAMTMFSEALVKQLPDIYDMVRTQK